MKIIREQLLELMRSSLWGTSPSPQLFEGEVDWSALLLEAKKQSILAPIYSQMESLQSRPSKQVMMRLHTLTTLNRKSLLQALQALDKITKRLRAAGIERPVLLKGVGVSMNYLDPGVRQCGDIDLYVGKEHYDLACEVAASWDESITSRDSKSRKHFEFHFDGIPIELHRIAVSSSSTARHSSKFDAWCTAQLEGEELRHETISGVEVYLPPYNFDAIYIFYHAWNHFCSFGISFRQISDWCRYLTKYHDQIDHKEVCEKLEYFGLTNPWGFFGALATEHMGLEQKMLISFDPAKNWHTEKVAERVWQGGNFGYHSKAHSSSRNILRRKTQNFLALFHSFAFIFSIDASYAISFLLRTPLRQISANIFRLFYFSKSKK